jgi:hypothetical protein
MHATQTTVSSKFRDCPSDYLEGFVAWSNLIGSLEVLRRLVSPMDDIALYVHKSHCQKTAPPCHASKSDEVPLHKA